MPGKMLPLALSSDGYDLHLPASCTAKGRCRCPRLRWNFCELLLLPTQVHLQCLTGSSTRCATYFNFCLPFGSFAVFSSPRLSSIQFRHEKITENHFSTIISSLIGLLLMVYIPFFLLLFSQD